MAQIQSDLTQGGVSQKLLRYCLPLLASSLLQSVYSITDYIVVAQFIGGNGTSAINNASVIMNMLTQIAVGLSLGGNILVGQYFGKGENERRKGAAGTIFLLCLLVGLVGAAIFIGFARPIMVLLGAPALEEAVAYFSICAVGVFFIFSYNALSAILRGVGNSRVPMYCVVSAVCLNVILDLVFVVGLDWGVRGAAVATVIGQAVAFLTALCYVLVHGAHLGLRPHYLKLRSDMVKNTLRLGMPTALQFTIASVSWLTVVCLINSYGVAVSAGNGASNKIRDFCQLFITAMTGGAGTMCAQCLGAGLHDRAVQVMKTCLKITLLMSVVIIAVAELFAPQLVLLFTSTPEEAKWAVLNLRIEIVCQIFYAGMFSYNTLATGSGHTVFIMWNSFLNCIVVRLVLAIIFNALFGVVGVYVACGVAVASSVPVSYWFYRSNRWRTSLNVR